MKCVNAPVSSPMAPRQSRWSVIRDSSAMMTRMYWQRGGTSMPISFSTARCQATLLDIGEM